MNNIPKFRAWHKEYKQMRLVDELWLWHKPPNIIVPVGLKDVPHRFDVVWQSHEIELMQWTGWNDKKGTPIFLGDILLGGWGDDSGQMRVEWDADKCMFQFMWMGSPKDSFEFDEFSENDLLIIGNIFENRELLEEK